MGAKSNRATRTPPLDEPAIWGTSDKPERKEIVGREGLFNGTVVGGKRGNPEGGIFQGKKTMG